MDIIAELKKILLSLDVEESVVDDLNPHRPLAGHILDSAGYIAFTVAMEERFGIKIEDQGSTYVRCLNDFRDIVEGKTETGTAACKDS